MKQIKYRRRCEKCKCTHFYYTNEVIEVKCRRCKELNIMPIKELLETK